VYRQHRVESCAAMKSNPRHLASLNKDSVLIWRSAAL
jgi:hypothetical protein